MLTSHTDPAAPVRREPSEERLDLQIWGDSAQPTLVYLPGLHGDWTLVRSFRQRVSARVRFVEITYPRTLTWSLEDYADAIEQELAAHQIHQGWLLGESFGSQIGWQIAYRNQFKVSGLILAGGFARHPFRLQVVIAERLMKSASAKSVRQLFRAYAALAKIRYRSAPEVLQDLSEFVARRTDLDRRASQHRLQLILNNDLSGLASDLNVPVYALTGLVDVIVPWWPVRRWLHRSCKSFREHKIIWTADHTVLATAPDRSSRAVLAWMMRGDARLRD